MHRYRFVTAPYRPAPLLTSPLLTFSLPVCNHINELVEIRARQRTFHGAYSRTALGSLGYALTILRLFDTRFRKIGLLFAALGVLLFGLAFIRARHSTHDFADRHKEAATLDKGLATVGQGGRNFGRPFVTAGWIVIQVTVLVAVVEIVIFVCLDPLDHELYQSVYV
ncbi:hypothetical protein NP233_g5271 [Leucocoprinus birnbaumii]|uniref:DUF202 domain-containing protein n=1 Tax=Leucocoprinus birnbaumii TaxID=56174 RepID=A0AAD5YWW4_9AGAR|nr:hypothetical protein NP233_g5271 [Leucocoprinus birnbaumii]